MERYRLLGIEHDGRESASARVVSREPNKWGVFPLHTFNSGDEVVLAADAQATIEALEQRVKELKQWVQDQSTANLETMRHMDEMQSRAMDAESQLTQRTAALEAAKAELEQERVRLASCLIAAEGGTKDIVKQGDYGWSPAYQATLNLHAELERVRGELAEERAMMLLTNEVLIPSLQHRQGMEG